MKPISFIVSGLFLIQLGSTLQISQDLPAVTGTLITYENISSAFVDSRRIDIWLPPSYKSDTDNRYPVLYMHDGQNLFDPGNSFIGVDWGIDETMTRLIDEGIIREAIVVGIWNTHRRFFEYMPQRPIEELVREGLIDPTKEEFELPVSDRYLKFIVEELKPFVDGNYKTLSGRNDTFIMGSSMGGLISLYAVCEYPNVFGSAGCVSTHWPAARGIVIDYFRENIPVPGVHKFYFDYGTETIDSLYDPYQEQIDEIMVEAGYRNNIDWLTVKYDGDEHSERAWRRRVHIPIIFLIGM
jgi:predicted alpha/beta superfamily hydrolase